MMMIEDFKRDINDSLREIQENTGKQEEAFKRKHKNPSKNYGKTQPNRFNRIYLNKRFNRSIKRY